MIFGIGNEYQDVYGDLYKLKSDFNGCLCQEKPANNCCFAINRPKTGVTLAINWYFVGHGKIMIFSVKIPQWVRFQEALELLNFNFFGQRYDQFT